jgi:hypothetical protein
MRHLGRGAQLGVVPHLPPPLFRGGGMGHRAGSGLRLNLQEIAGSDLLHISTLGRVSSNASALLKL